MNIQRVFISKFNIIYYNEKQLICVIDGGSSKRSYCTYILVKQITISF